MNDEIKAHLETISQQDEAKGKLEAEKEAMNNQIRERDKTIGEKERRIYDLKRKNGELEKFKNVLDYKIKDLRREMTPREEEIARMKEQTSEMDRELKHLNGVNENLGIIVDNLRRRQDGM
jgi:chromosome segregation ATPase